MPYAGTAGELIAAVRARPCGRTEKPAAASVLTPMCAGGGRGMIASASNEWRSMVGESTRKTQRILYVAHQACGNPELCAEVRAHAAAGAEVLVAAPVLSSPLHRWTSDYAEDRELAQARLDESIGCLRRSGLRVRGTLGDADPVQAIADALFGFPAEEIVICLEEPERPHWLRKGIVERARERFGVPVTEIDVAMREPAVVA